MTVNPVPVMAPPVADQVTAVLVVPVTAAVNCCVAPDCSVAEVGEIVIATGAAATVSESALVAVTGVGAESLAAKVGLKDPEAVGVPEIAPVLALRLTPAGNAPAEIDHVYGVTPPLACSVAL